MFLYGLDVSSGGPISKNQAAMDVKHYFLDLRVDPHKKSISGTSTIQFILKEDIPTLEIDLYKKLTVSGVSIGGTNLDFKHKGHKVFVENPGVDLFVLHRLKIKYGGRPPIAKRPPWDGGFTWERGENGDPWVGVSCQGNGAYIWYPCKEHPSDKADSADIKITAPDPVMAVSNGLLISKNKTEGRWTTWHWKTKYPISTYNINFTLGNYEVVEKEGYVLDKPLKIVYYFLPEAKNGAMELLELSEEYLNFYANHFGQYPWIKEKFGLVHTPYWGMEHQTINAYGNDYKKTKLGYDFILFHEMGHEWFGNYLSVADWSEFWIHEGFDTYAEAIYIEEKFGQSALEDFLINRYIKNIKNEYPVVPQKGATTNQPSGNDVYYKGAYVLHTLRYLIGDDIFKSSVKEFLHMPKNLPNNQTTTEEFISLIEENTNKRLNWFFDVYLYSSELPVLNIKKEFRGNKQFIDLWWDREGFIMPLEISYKSFDGIRKRKVDLSNNPSRIGISANSKFNIDPNKYVLFKQQELK